MKNNTIYARFPKYIEAVGQSLSEDSAWLGFILDTYIITNKLFCKNKCDMHGLLCDYIQNINNPKSKWKINRP